MGDKTLPAKKALIRAIKNVERTGERAESGHDQAVAVGGEAATPHRTATLDDHRAGMKMTSNLTGLRASQRLVTEAQTADGDFLRDYTW